MALIYFFSAQPDLGTGLGVWDTILRKAAHMAEYGLLWYLWHRALELHSPWPAAAITLAYAASDERDFVVPTRLSFDNTGSDIYTIIEVETRDRPGLLYDLARTLTANSISISSAIIATYGEQAVDVFYVKDLFGLKLQTESKRRTLEARLRAVIDGAAR